MGCWGLKEGDVEGRREDGGEEMKRFGGVLREIGLSGRERVPED